MSQSALEPGSPSYSEQVALQLFKLRVQKEARKLLDADSMTKIDLPASIAADDPLPPEPPELITGILLTHGATEIAGEKETGKSAVALEIQHSLITGEPLWGSLVPNIRVEKTIHFLAEHSSSILMGLYQRMQLSTDHKLRIFGPEHLSHMRLLVSNGIRREESVSFYKRLAEGAGLVVFDPLAAFIQGQAAENDNAPMRSLVDTMIEIASSTGAACLVLAHQGKPVIFQGRQVKRGNYSTRGASATEDAMAAVHYLEKLSGVSIGGNMVLELRPIHYKGFKQPAFQLIRDKVTCRHTLNTTFKLRSQD